MLFRFIGSGNRLSRLRLTRAVLRKCEMAYILIVLWLICPFNFIKIPHRMPAPFWDALKLAALKLEVVGPTERWIPDFRSEANYVKNHWRELKNAPPLGDVVRFPVEYISKQNRVFNLQYQHNMELKKCVYSWKFEDMEEGIREAKGLQQVWVLVDTAVCPTQSWCCRRKALMELRELRGDEAYYSGDLPPCVPLWRFATVERWECNEPIRTHVGPRKANAGVAAGSIRK